VRAHGHEDSASGWCRGWGRRWPPRRWPPFVIGHAHNRAVRRRRGGAASTCPRFRRGRCFSPPRMMCRRSAEHEEITRCGPGDRCLRGVKKPRVSTRTRCPVYSPTPDQPRSQIRARRSRGNVSPTSSRISPPRCCRAPAAGGVQAGAHLRVVGVQGRAVVGWRAHRPVRWVSVRPVGVDEPRRAAQVRRASRSPGAAWRRHLGERTQRRDAPAAPPRPR